MARSARLARFVQANAEAVTDAWIRRVRERLPSVADESDEVLRDHIEEFLIALAPALASGAKRGKQQAMAHGKTRREEGYSLDLMVHEYELLRDVVLEEAEKSGVPLRDRDLLALGGHLASAVGRAAASFVQSGALATLERVSSERDRIWSLSADLICVAGPDARFRRVNPSFTRTLGWGEKELLSREFLDLIHPDDLSATLAELDRIARGVGADRFENRFRTKDGAYRWLSWSSTPLEDGAIYAVARDITDQRRHEERLHQLMEEAEEHARFEQRLLGVVSHDLRNPLGAILMTVRLLSREVNSDQARRHLQLIRSAAERAVRLIADLLDLTRVRLGGELPIDPRPLELTSLVETVREEMMAAFPERTIRVRAPGPLQGVWDGDRLGQLLTNLLVNALRYSPPHTLVTVTLGARPEGVLIAIHNEGPPIPEDLLPLLFQPLERGAQKGRRDGVGLGLFIARQIARSHGGDISLRSSATQGTCVEVSLPGKSLPSHPEETSSERSPEPH